MAVSYTHLDVYKRQEELRELMSYDELELDTLGDRKTALFLIMSDTDDTFNSVSYTHLLMTHEARRLMVI